MICIRDTDKSIKLCDMTKDVGHKNYSKMGYNDTTTHASFLWIFVSTTHINTCIGHYSCVERPKFSKMGCTM